MVIAGIDEAGYGPLLGPLVVGCCAFELGGETLDPDAESWPCLWKKLGRYVSRNRSKSGRKLHVNDSKIVYAPADGLKELERSVLALVAAQGEWCADLKSLLTRIAPHAVADLEGYAWYQPGAAEAFPLEQEGTAIRLLAKALREHMDAAATRCVHLAARVVFERQFNRMLEATRNKSSTLFSVSAVHLAGLLRDYGRRGLVIICDRQGGREHYGHLLRLMFEDWSLSVNRERDGYSDYTLRQDGHVARVIFREKAEVHCMSVAAASMLSKYLREAMMRRFNAYWAQLMPDLNPTAGYYGDGIRFLTDIQAKRREMGISDELLIRSR